MKFRIKFSLIIALLLGFNEMKAQNEAEIKKKIRNTTNNQDKVSLYFALGELVFERNLDSAKHYYDLAKQIAIQEKDVKNQIKYCSYLGSVLTYEGKYDELLKLMKQGLALAESINDKENIARCTANIGNSYNYLSNYPKAIHYFQRAIELFKANNQPQYERKINMFILLCYHNSNMQDKAIEYGELILKQATEAKDSTLLVEAYGAIGEEYIEKREELKGEKYTLEGLRLAKVLHLDSKIAQFNLDLSRILFKKKQTIQAINIAERALRYFNTTGNEFYKVNNLVFLADYYVTNKNPKAAIKYLLEAKNITEKNEMKAHFPLVYEGLFKANKAFGNHHDALFYFEKFRSIEDSLNSKDLKLKIQDLDVKYQTEKNKAKIINLEKEKQSQNILIYSLIVGLLAVGIIGFIGFRNINYRRKLAEKELIQLHQEKQLTATESIIKGQEEERSRLAKDLHDGLGGILSSLKYTLTTMTGNYILSEQGTNLFAKALETLETAISEMRRVAHSMMPEILLKFGLKDAIESYCEGINHSGKLRVNFQIYGLETRLDQTVEITIYRIVQELLNNIMKHSGASKALVQLSKTNETLLLTVEDNGKGFDEKILEQNIGAGLTNIKSRVAYLNGNIEIQSKPNEGTSTIIEFNI